MQDNDSCCSSNWLHVATNTTRGNVIVSSSFPMIFSRIFYSTSTASCWIREFIHKWKKFLKSQFFSLISEGSFLNMPRELRESLVSTVSNQHNFSKALSQFELPISLRDTSAQLVICVASPKVYSYICARQLLMLRSLWQQYNSMEKAELSASSPQLYQYIRNSWTFHSKGIWFYSPKESLLGPYATTIGSSNFGLRSKWRDLDLTFYVETRNSKLQNALLQEISNLLRFSKPVQDIIDLKRSCPKWLKILLHISSLDTFF